MQHSLFYFCFLVIFTVAVHYVCFGRVLILPVLNSEAESERVIQPAHLPDRIRLFFIAADNVVKSLKTTLQDPNLIIAKVHSYALLSNKTPHTHCKWPLGKFSHTVSEKKCLE